MSEDPTELTPYDLTAEPKAYVFVQPGWGERLAELAPRVPEYCNVCENFLCLGNHPPDVGTEAREQYERAAALIRQGWVTRAELEREVLGHDIRPIYFSPLRNSLVIREGFAAEKRAAEERDRCEWIEGIRRRLGLVAEVHRCQGPQGQPGVDLVTPAGRLQRGRVLLPVAGACLRESAPARPRVRAAASRSGVVR